MRRNASLSTIFRFSALAALPLLLGAKGGGCSFGGDVPVGQDQDHDGGSCSLDDCAGIASTNEAKVCSDGSSLGRTVCAKKGDGTCFWDFPACPSGSTPAGSCTQEDCAGIAASLEAKICPDGTGVGRSLCTRNAAGQCFWDFPPCPSVDAGAMACTLADCMGKPAETDARLCPDGTALGRSACVRGSTGVCNWDFPACPPASRSSPSAPPGADSTAAVPGTTSSRRGWRRGTAPRTPRPARAPPPARGSRPPCDPPAAPRTHAGRRR